MPRYAQRPVIDISYGIHRETDHELIDTADKDSIKKFTFGVRISGE